MLKLLKRARQPSGCRAAVRSRAFTFQCFTVHRHACLPLSLLAPAFVFAAPAATPESTPDPRDADAIQLAPVVVTSSAGSSARSPLDPNLPATTATVTADQSQYWNVVTPEDVLKYVPNMAVRKRFIGDVNS